MRTPCMRGDPSSGIARIVLRIARSNAVLRAALRKYDW